MERLAFNVSLRLLSSAEGGRQGPIRGDYRTLFDIGSAWRGKPTLTDGRVLLDRELSPGEEANATLEPLCPEYWGHVQERMTLAVLEGSRLVGHATVTQRLLPAHFSPEVAAFACAAVEFCDHVGKARAASPNERLRTTRHLLLSLYAAATELADVASTTDSKAPSYPVPEGWGDFAEHDVYWEVFDPYRLEDPVAGSLSEDVLDVYRDVRAGLYFWEKHEIAAAIEAWRFSFRSHWGDHAVDALRALHRACESMNSGRERH